MIRIDIAIGTVVETQRFQEVCAFNLVNAIENFYMIGGAAIHGRFRKLDDIGDLQVTELNAFDGVAVADLAVAEVRFLGTAQNAVYAVFVIAACRNIGTVPYAVALGGAEIILINSYGTNLIFVNEDVFGGGGDLRCGCANGNSQDHNERQKKRQSLCQISHIEKFLSKNSRFSEVQI